MIEIEKITLYHLSMNLKKPFKNSIETLQERKFLIVEAIDTSGVTGWGEVSAFSSPWYTEETIGTCLHMLKDFYSQCCGT